MKRTSVSEAKSHLSGLLREVENGESFLVMSRNRPIARIEPVSGSIEAGDATDRLTRLERLGVVRRPRGQDHRHLRDLAQPRLRNGTSAVAVLVQDREAGR